MRVWQEEQLARWVSVYHVLPHLVYTWLNVKETLNTPIPPQNVCNVNFSTAILSSNSANFWLCAVWSGKCATCSIPVWCAVFSAQCVVWSVQVKVQVQVQVQVKSICVSPPPECRISAKSTFLLIDINSLYKHIHKVGDK